MCIDRSLLRESSDFEGIFLFVLLIDSHPQTPAATRTTISSACPKCGAIEKSGKTSCCGRGGSWFRNCGSAGNSHLKHTWHEGIRACATRARAHFKRVVGPQVNAAQAPSSSASTTMMSLGNTSAKMLMTSLTRTKTLVILTDITTSATVITDTTKKAAIKTDWIPQCMCYAHDTL